GGVYSETSLNPFVAVYLAKKEFVVNYVDPGISLALNDWYYYWDVDTAPALGTWCVYWFWPTFKEAYEHGPVICEEKWTRYDGTTIQAGLEAGTHLEPTQDGNDIVATATAPHSPFEYFVPWAAAKTKKEFGPAGTCGKNDPYWSEYPGSITFGAGAGVCGGKEGELLAAASPQLPEGTNPWTTSTPAVDGAKLSMGGVRKIVTEQVQAPTGTLSISQGNVWEALHAFPSDSGSMPLNKDNEAWMGREAYLVTMAGSFSYEGPRPPHSQAIVYKHEALVVDSHTGQIEATYIGEKAPVAAGAVTTLAEE
ncbi:MAG TPA: hypothetical protein VGG08_03040, partial [Solirubrobacteraceae bacterium]